MSFVFEKKVNAGHVLTVLTILVSVVSLLVAWNREADQRLTDRANQIRAAAAKALVKLDRWKAVSMSMFDMVKPDFVDTKEMLKKRFDIVEARDHLWKALHVTRVSMLKHAMDEQVEMSYLELYAYHPEIRELFHSTLAKLKAEEQQAFSAFLAETENVVLSWEGRKKDYTTAALWGDLSEVSNKQQAEYQKKLSVHLNPLMGILNSLITLSDREILRKPNLLTLSKAS
jgi:hypothetical protein